MRRRQAKIRRPLQLAALSVPALLALAAGKAEAGPVADLCGTTVTQGRTIQDVTDTLTADCSITVADKVALVFRNVVLDAGGFSLNITGLGRASVAMPGARIDNMGESQIVLEDGNLTVGPNAKLTVRDDKFLVLQTRDGDILFTDSDLFADDESPVTIEATGRGSIEVSGNTLEMDSESDLLIRTQSGKVLVRNNAIFFEEDDSLIVASTSGRVDVRENTIVEARVGVSSESGAVWFRDNVGDADALFLETDTGAIHVLRNDVNVLTTLSVESSTGKVVVKDNNFGAPVSTLVTTGGHCQTKDNTPALVCS